MIKLTNSHCVSKEALDRQKGMWVILNCPTPRVDNNKLARTRITEIDRQILDRPGTRMVFIPTRAKMGRVVTVMEDAAPSAVQPGVEDQKSRRGWRWLLTRI